jgi:Ca2+-binding EF-hand superfamily protein
MKKSGSLLHKQIINYVELLNSLKKCKELLKKEKVWNIFKNYDQKGEGYIAYDQTISAFHDIFEKKVYYGYLV